MSRVVDFGKSVDLDKRLLNYVSVSAVTDFDPTQYGGCNRSWFYYRVLGKEKPKTRALEIGGQVHTQIEHYELTGEDTLGAIARAGKHLIPKPGPGILVEHEFGGGSLYKPTWDQALAVVRATRPKRADESDADYQVALRNRAFVKLFEQWRAIQAAVKEGRVPARDGRAPADAAKEWYEARLPREALVAHGIPFVGYIDVVNMRDHWLDNEGQPQPQDPDKEREVNDWKTTGDLRYAKSKLEETVQMPGYGEYMRRLWPGLERVRLSHSYLQTSSPHRAEKRTVLITMDTLERRWKHVEEQVLRMTQVVRETDVEKIEPHLPSCTAYGKMGCPHQAYCPRASQSIFSDMFSSSVSPTASTPLTTTDSESNNANTNNKQGTSNMSMASYFSTPTAVTPTSAPAAPLPPPIAQVPAATPVSSPADVAAAKSQLLAAEAAAKAGTPPAQAAAQSFFAAPVPDPVAIAAAAHAAAQATAPQPAVASTPAAIGFCTVCGGHLTAENTSKTPQGALWHMTSEPHQSQVKAGAAQSSDATTAAVAVVNAVQQVALGATVSIVPPDAPVSVPPGNAKPLPADHPLAHLNPLVPSADAAAQTVAGGSATGASASQAGAGGAGGAVSAETSAVSPAATPTPPVATSAPAETAVKGGRKKSEKTAAAEGLTLYVDCHPIGEAAKDLESYIAELHRTVALKAGVVDREGAPIDVRLVSDDKHPLHYGKWKAALAEAARRSPPANGAWTVQIGGCEVKQAVVAGLRSIATGGAVGR